MRLACLAPILFLLSLTSAHTDVGGLATRLEEKEKEWGHPAPRQGTRASGG